MATSRQSKVFASMFDLDDKDDKRDHDYFLTAEVPPLIKILEGYCNCERKHPYTPKEWKAYRECVTKVLKRLGLSRAIRWSRQEHLPGDKSYVNISINPVCLTNGVACYLVYNTLKTFSFCYIDKGANIWEYIPKEKKRTGLRH